MTAPLKPPGEHPCVGCRLRFPLYKGHDGRDYHQDGAGGILCAPSHSVTQEVRSYMLNMIRGGFVTSDPEEIAKDEAVKPS